MPREPRRGPGLNGPGRPAVPVGPRLRDEFRPRLPMRQAGGHEPRSRLPLACLVRTTPRHRIHACWRRPGETSGARRATSVRRCATTARRATSNGAGLEVRNSPPRVRIRNAGRSCRGHAARRADRQYAQSPRLARTRDRSGGRGRQVRAPHPSQARPRPPRRLEGAVQGRWRRRHTSNMPTATPPPVANAQRPHRTKRQAPRFG